MKWFYRVLTFLHLRRDPLKEQYEYWLQHYTLPGEFYNFAYFVQVLGAGESELAQRIKRRHEALAQERGKQ